MAVESIKGTLNCQGHIQDEELRRRLREGESLYPNIDTSVSLRSCEKEIIEPLYGTTTGKFELGKVFFCLYSLSERVLEQSSHQEAND